jgi:dipeptidyl aminopeptidase/acylaminoacyl peptidase
VSLDLPSHGENRQPGEPEGIEGWRWRVDKQQDIVQENNVRVKDILNDLIARGLTDGTRVAVSGISRGGFMAAHYALHDTRVRAVGLMSPVTNLTLLTEFDGYTGQVRGGGGA